MHGLWKRNQREDSENYDGMCWECWDDQLIEESDSMFDELMQYGEVVFCGLVNHTQWLLKKRDFIEKKWNQNRAVFAHEKDQYCLRLAFN